MNTSIANAVRLGMFYDTETSGLPDWNQPSDGPQQPHIVQIAAKLVDLDTRQEHASFDVIVKPDRWTIPEDVAQLHGITTERALKVGISERIAVGMLLNLHSRATVRIAHNESFDMRIVRIALKRFGTYGEPADFTVDADSWKAAPAECTQVLSTPILKLPPTAKMRAVNRNHYKSANLSEAFAHFTGANLTNAHSAMADVNACIAVYFAIKPPKAIGQQAGGAVSTGAVVGSGLSSHKAVPGKSDADDLADAFR